jgi:large subunit ribosomal protein L7Ae
MPKAPRSKKTPAPAPYDASKKPAKAGDKKKKPESPLFEKRPKNFGIGNDIQPRRDVTRFVKWPRYVKLQRQKRVLMHRLKVPPTLNQFTRTLDKNTAAQLFKLLLKYRPEDRAEKKARLLKLAEEQVAAAKAKKEQKKEGQAEAPKPAEKKVTKKPVTVKYGINHVTSLIEQKKAKLVVIAHDVDPIEIVVWLPTLCRKMEIPYCIVKSKARLGQIVRKKTATALVVTDVNPADKNDFIQLMAAIKENFNDKFDEVRRMWGGGKLGPKSQAARSKKAKAVAKEEASRAKAGAQ